MSNIELISLDDNSITLGLRARVISHPSENNFRYLTYYFLTSSHIELIVNRKKAIFNRK